MSEWWTYTLSDFLMFSPQVYHRLFELHNRALWPAQLLTLAAGFAIIGLLLRRDNGKLRIMVAILGAIWIWMGWAFFWERYGAINWAVLYVAPFIAAQGLLLIGLGAFGKAPLFAPRSGPGVLASLALFVLAALCYPFLAPLMGRPWLAAEVFGIAPDPTAVATLALLALAHGRFRWLLMPIPALWCVISAATLWTMGAADFFIPIAGAFAAITIALLGKFDIIK